MGTLTSPTTLTARERRTRVAATAAVFIALLTGTLAGTDDHFPLGPFRMFATTNKWDEPVSVARAEIVDSAGTRIELTEANSGVRRAEIEGQLDEFRGNPPLLKSLASAYQARHPGGPRPVAVIVMLRHHELSRHGPTGRWRDEVVAAWQV